MAEPKMATAEPEVTLADPGMTGPGQPFGALRRQLRDAAAEFTGGPDALAGILTGIVADVDRALREELEIFPVCHHSPASALAMARRLRDKQPKVIYLELCEDLQPLLTELRNCHLPVALQAFASDLDGFPPGWGPLSVVAPITEASAEYQAIAYALDTPGVELVLVDRSTDHVFQWSRPDPTDAADPGDPTDPATPAGPADPAGPAGPADPADPAGPAGSGHGAGGGGAAGVPGSAEALDGAHRDDAALHGDAVGIEIGDLRPRFAELEAHLLRHGRVRHWSEWWDQYVEQPLVGADYDTYRQVMVLIGSLFRRLRPADADAARRDRDEDRERYMWTRMRQHLAAADVAASECLYVCGAFHAASPVEQFGADATAPFEISPRTGTKWLYGLIPSSHSAIEAQFGLASGSVSIAATTWTRALTEQRVTPFRLDGQQGRKAPKKRTSRARPASGASTVAGGPSAAEAPAAAVTDRLTSFLASPPAPQRIDEAELLGWCVEIVRLARRNGYLASTADAIAVFETSILLAGMRNRRRPTPYDFQDAAVTCIEKDVVPGRRDVRRLCEILFGGDRIGKVGYDSLPPLARDVHDRLAPLGLDLEKRTVQRALLTLDAQPELAGASDLLWVLHRLMPEGAVRPIMGERRLGERSVQESWDLALGRHQRALIELGYEGVTIEQVLEQRLRRSVHEPNATAAIALAAVEDALLFLRNRRFTDELGARAVELLAAERSVDDAPEVLRRIRRLLAHYRATEPALPGWCDAFVTAGYAHYCTLLPTAFVEEETGARQVAAMLGFLFTMESLALSLGCDRSQLELAVRQCHPEAPAKVSLLWAARFQLGLLSLAELRARCDELLANPLVVPAFPRYLSGLVQALEPVPALAPFVVEMMSKAFARLPDPVLLPWLPTLIATLRGEAGELLPVLVREAGRTFPGTLAAVDGWRPPWQAPAPPASGAAAPALVHAPDPALVPVTELVGRHPDAVEAVAALLGWGGEWPLPAAPAAAGLAAAGLAAAGLAAAGSTAAGPTPAGSAAPAAAPQAAAPARRAVHALLARHPASGAEVARLLALGTGTGTGTGSGSGRRS